MAQPDQDPDVPLPRVSPDAGDPAVPLPGGVPEADPAALIPPVEDLDRVEDVANDLARTMVGQVVNPPGDDERVPVGKLWEDAIAASSLADEAEQALQHPIPLPRVGDDEQESAQPDAEIAEMRGAVDEQVEALVREYGRRIPEERYDSADLREDTPEGRRLRAGLRGSLGEVEKRLLASASEVKDRGTRQTERRSIEQGVQELRGILDTHSTAEELNEIIQHRLQARMRKELGDYHDLDVKAKGARIPAQGQIRTPVSRILQDQRLVVERIEKILASPRITADERVTIELFMEDTVSTLAKTRERRAEMKRVHGDMMIGMKYELGSLRAMRNDPEFELLDDETGAVVRAGTGWKVRPTTPQRDVEEHTDFEVTMPGRPSSVELDLDVKAAGSFRETAGQPLAGLPPAIAGAFKVKVVTIERGGRRQQHEVLVVDVDAFGGLADGPTPGDKRGSIDIRDQARFAAALKIASRAFAAAYPQATRIV